MKKIFSVAVLFIVLSFNSSLFAQAGLVISEMLPNPDGNDSPYEYVELVATQNINFATTPYTVVFTNNGTATSNGWKEGKDITYAFQISSGTVTVGQVVYVGGSSMRPASNGGLVIRSINTSSTNGDSFGNKGSDVFGNGGDNCDGVAVFNMKASSITGSTVPVDAVFFGDGVGAAFKSSGSGYQLPVNDKYAGGKLQKNSYIASDPGADELVKATSGTYNTLTGTWTAARSWSKTSSATYSITSIVLTGATPVNQLPTVSITAPANNATYTSPASVAITATASDADGSISKVEFYNGATLLGSDASSPYSFNWASVASGTYTLTAKAYDNLSATSTSSTVTIIVNPSTPTNQAPTVAITSPANNATYTAPATVAIAATASDADGSISKVEFYNGATLLGSDASSPYSFSWTNVAAGTYTLTAKAYDNLSATSTSSTVTILVNSSTPTNQAPTVAITSPANNASYTAPATVAITATASDADGSINKVEFYNGSTLLGADATSPYTFTWNSVAAGTYSLSARAYDNLGLTTTSGTTTIKVNSTVNNAPVLTFLSNASRYVNLASGKVSCVMNNATDPVIVKGLDINVTDEDLASLTFQMTSSKTSVVANANFTIVGTDNARKFKISPSAVGYTNITLKVTDNTGKTSQIAFSLAVSNSLNTVTLEDVYSTGISDGSTAIPVDENYMLVADDETNFIRLFDRHNSGLSLYQFDAGQYLNLEGTELDVECSFVSPTNPRRIYWLGSMGNSKSGEPRPDRNRLFATDMVGTGINTTLKFVGYYDNLRSKLIAWGDAKGYNFTAKAKTGIIPKRIDGFNIEGFEMGPDGTTAYIAFRAPYVGTSKNKALICPFNNFESWFNNGSPSGNPSFGNPIELSLGTRGIRSLGKNASNEYLIVAGTFDDVVNFALYAWNGQPTSAPVLLDGNLSGLKPEGIAEVPASLSEDFQVQLISDMGTMVWYNDAIENKALTEGNYKKFLVSTVSVSGTNGKADIATGVEEVSSNNALLKVYPNPTSSTVRVELTLAANGSAVVMIYNMMGALVKQVSTEKGSIDINLNELVAGNYLVTVQGSKERVIITKQ